ncbi:MAG TPA: hemerythrin domain-containing protein [Agromyces sp.]|nr:hemerythrin domain-containing protein [Agromyces sp.]
MPNIVDLLKQDHRGVKDLFAKFENTQESSIADEICEELELHTAAEEQFVYPALREGVSGGDALADKAEHEHAEAKQLIGRIKRTSAAEHLSEVVSELEQAIEHHVEEEESTVFPKMQSELGATEMDTLGAQVEEFKESA